MPGGMVDYFAIGVTHGLMLLMAWRLFLRDDLDAEAVPDTPDPAPGKAGQ